MIIINRYKTYNNTAPPPALRRVNHAEFIDGFLVRQQGGLVNDYHKLPLVHLDIIGHLKVWCDFDVYLSQNS